MLKGDESSQTLDYRSHYCNSKFCVTVAFSLLGFYIYYIFPYGTDQLIYTFFSGILEKRHSLILYFFNVDPVIWRYSCRIWISEWILQDAGFPTKITGGLQSSPHTPLSSVHHIWLDCCFGNRCNVASDFIMIKWGEKNRTKEHIPVSTCNLETETVSHTFSVFQSTFQ